MVQTSLTDPDSGAVEGIAIYGFSGSGGTLEYSLDGTNWTVLPAVDATNALLLRATDSLRFTPATDNGGTMYLDYRGWDQTSGSAGTQVDATTTGGSTAFSTASDQVTVNITDVNDAPVESTIEGTALAYTENDGAVAITSTIVISDVDDTNIESALIQFTGNYVNGEDVLAFTDQNGIAGSWNATTGEMTLSGTATLGEYETAIRSITYENTSGDPSIVTRTVSFTVHDGDVDSNTLTRDIDVTSANDPPVLSAGAATTNTEGTISVPFGSSTVSDVDSADFDGGSMTVTITSAGRLKISCNSGRVMVLREVEPTYTWTVCLSVRGQADQA